MVLKRFGLVAALLAAVCCGALLAGCANGDNDENDSDYEEKKALDYWNKDYKADDYEWQDITDDNKDSIIGTWKTVYECTKEALDNVNDKEVQEIINGEIGYSVSMEFVVDDSFKCKFTFIDDSSKCKSKRHYYTPWQDSDGNISYDGAKVRFPREFDVKGYGFTLNFDDKKCIATATAENLSLEQLIEVLRCKRFSISTTGNRLCLRGREADTSNLATWIFTGDDGEVDEESGRHCADYVIARVE